MDPLISLFSVLLALSAATFMWLTWFEGRRAKVRVERPGPVIALDDLVGASRPLTPRTIRQTSIE